MNYDKKFTVEKGIEIQTRDLAFWKPILNAEVYAALYERTISRRHLAKNGFDVFRGNDLDNFIKNYQSPKDLEIAQLKHRLSMIADDHSKFIEFLDENRLMEVLERPTKYSDSAWAHLNNIEIASDLLTDESLEWSVYSTDDEVKPTPTLPMEKTSEDVVAEVINTLNEIDVDGETMQYILKEVGMEGQMLRQLVMTNNYNMTSNLLAEKYTEK